jgi:hypothetical protein
LPLTCGWIATPARLSWSAQGRRLTCLLQKRRLTGFGVMGIPQEAEADAAHHRAVALDQGRERGLVTGVEEPFQEHAVAAPAARMHRRELRKHPRAVTHFLENRSNRFRSFWPHEV